MNSQDIKKKKALLGRDRRVYPEQSRRAYPESHRRVFAGMSGGVDSSVAAYLLKKQGYDVVGVFMRSYNLDGCAEQDAEDARRVAEKLQIPFYVFDFEEEYKKKVVDYMIQGYKDGITPNPDVMCNKEIKFGIFLEKALELGADFVATGHYVRLRKSQISNSKFQTNYKSQNPKKLEIGNWKLEIARDEQKDQSYFLWTLNQEQLRHCLFPIGDYLKSEVREIAKSAGLPTAEKKDSQGICFLGKVSLEDFLKQYIAPKSGKILDSSGRILGEHEGVYYYTIGQRHLGANFQFPISNFQIKNRKDRKPVYVAEKNIKTNTLVVAEGDNSPALYKKEIEIEDMHFINPELRDKSRELRVFVRVRYRQPLAPAVLKIENRKLSARGESAIGGKIEFNQPVKFVAPGQSAVFYNQAGQMLGGGIISL